MNFAEHFVKLYRTWRQNDQPNHAPILPGTPVLGHLMTFRHDAFAVLRKADVLGDVVRFNLLHTPAYFVKHPDALGPMLDNQEIWLRGEGLQTMLGRNVLTTNGAEWKSNRELAQPSFHPKMTDSAAQDFVKKAASCIDEWHRYIRDNEIIDLAHESVRLFAQCATPAFGLHLLPTEVDAFPKAVLRLQRWAFAALVGGKALSRQESKDIEMLNTIVSRSLAKPAPANQPPSYLERIRQDLSIDRDRLRDHMMLLLIASSDNPPNAFAFAIQALADNPAWEEAVRTEIREVLGNELPTIDSLVQLPLLSRVVDEVLRLYPPVWMLARYSQCETTLLEHTIPANTFALIGTYFLHRHPSFWHEPERFNPDRFLPESMEKQHRLAYLPFGAGPRRCIGSRLALQEICLLLVLFLQKFRAQPKISGQLPLYGIFALRSTQGVPCQLVEVTR